MAFREQWQEQVLDPTGVPADPGDAGGLREGGPRAAVVPDGQQVRTGRFGVVIGEHLPPIPAPPLPNARLRQRH